MSGLQLKYIAFCGSPANVGYCVSWRDELQIAKSSTSGHPHPLRPHTVYATILFSVARDASHQYPLSYGVPVRERYGSTLLPATREQHDQNCTQSH